MKEKRLLRLLTDRLALKSEPESEEPKLLTASEARAILRQSRRMGQLKLGQTWVGRNERSYEQWQRYVAHDRQLPNRRRIPWCHPIGDLRS
jgi:hypothetical protein